MLKTPSAAGDSPAINMPDAADHHATEASIAQVEEHSTHNYHPLPVVIAEARAPGSPTSTGGATWTASPATRR